MSRHTRGPWAMRRNVDVRKRSDWGHEIFGPHGRRVALTDSRGLLDDESAANARLIAAAPEMLEALRSVEAMGHINNACVDGPCRCIQARVGAAIAKTEGKQP